jgi:inorganic pyrophosphatase
MQEISELIEDGAKTFLKAEYTYLAVFMVLFSILISVAVEKRVGEFWTVGSFTLGALTSILSGYIGMMIAVKANVRTTIQCQNGLHEGFVVAFRGGSVLGFMLVGFGLLMLQILLMFYVSIYPRGPNNKVQYQEIFECMAGYGLGGSTIALFGRVGGGIYTKAADVGSDLAGKVIEGLPEDDPRNPGVIADNVGDNVGDIAGMGSDLFGSFAESSCACLVLSSSSSQLINGTGFYYPLLISSFGILICLVTTFVSTSCYRSDSESSVETSLKLQLVISTILMTPVLFFLPYYCLPASFQFAGIAGSVTPWDCFLCTAVGLWSGLVIGWFTEYYTSNSYEPVQRLAQSCETGAAPNIIGGLALGYKSTIIPVLAIALTIYVSFIKANMYGISLGALGMLSTLTIALTIDGYGPISDNAGGIAEMCELEDVREKTDILDAAGNTTAAIGKGFAIGSACLVALALFGAFVTRSKQTEVNILQPLEFAGLIIGAMLPYAFSAMTMASVGRAAEDMIHEI